MKLGDVLDGSVGFLVLDSIGRGLTVRVEAHADRFGVSCVNTHFV